MSFDRTANLLGALALVVTDRTAEAAGRSESAAAALSWMRQFDQRPSIELLRRVLGLTSSGAVRLIDRLVADGLVKRGPGRDGRTTAVSLTPAGHRAAEKVAAARGAILEGALAALSEEERETLEVLHSKLLVGQMRDPGAMRWMCRLCDTGVCREGPGCPVTNAVRAR